MVKERLKSTEKQAEDLIKELEQEIEDLTNRSSEVKQLSHTKDHLHFLQAFRSLKNPPPTRDWTTVEVRPPSYVGTLRRTLDQLEETLNMEMKKQRDAELKGVQQYEVDVTLDPDTAHPQLIRSEDGKQVNDGDVVKKLPEDPKRLTHDMPVQPDLKPGLKKYACELTLDPNTAHRQLSLSEDNRRVRQLGITQGYPDHPQRFDYHRQVLCREGLTGRCYWEVEWKGRRIGVYLHRSAGTLSFYSVSPDVGGSSGKRTHIHTFHSTFTHDLYPGFLFWGSNSTVTLCRL
ncbi:unnamed protein product [Boreogadus saida]